MNNTPASDRRRDPTAGPPPAHQRMKAFARARFRGYRTQPGDIQLKMPDGMEIEVEVFKDRGDTWKARAVKGGGLFRGIQGPVEVALRLTQERFEEMLSPWQWVDAQGQPAEAATEPQGVYHLLAADVEQQQFLRVRRTLCGRTVMTSRIEHRLEKVNCPKCRVALEQIPVSK